MRTCNFIFLCCIFVAAHTLADERPESLATMTLKERPKIGLALSGGGARGAAHIGVLHVLEELRIPIDYIAGTSMGAIIGGLYASGMHSSDIETAMLATDWVSVFEDETPRPDVSFRRKRDDDLSLVSAKPGFRDGKVQFPPAFILGQKFDMVLNRLTLPVAKINDFNHLNIPFRALATNIITGEEVILSSGSLAVAMRASMSVPGAFAAVKMGDKLLVDGGVANNLPVDVVRAMGADIVIAIDISTPLLSHDEVNSALSIVDQLTGILTRRNTEHQLASLTDKDVLIVPKLGDISAGDFGRAVETIPVGIAAAELQRVKLQALSLSELDYAQYRGIENEDHLQDDPVINFVHIDNQSRLSDDFIAARLRIEKGERLDVTSLEEDISKLYGLDLFESVRYEIKEQHGSTGLVIHVREKRWGPNYLQFGFSLSADFEGGSSFNTAVAYTRTAINTRNGEWRTLLQAGEDPLIFTEFYQPVDVDSRYYVTSKFVLFEKINFNLFDKEKIVAGYRLKRQGMSLAVGRELGEWGDIRVGIQRFFGEANIRIGDPNVAGIEFDNGEAFVRFSADKVDDLYFPTSGYLVDIKWLDSHRSLGADTSFDQVLLDSMAAMTWDRQTFFSGLRFFSTTKNEAPIQNRFRAGGLQNLSGFQENELSGKNFGLFRLGTMRRINDIQWMPAYAGLTLEVGNVWEEAADIFSNDMLVGANVFLGVDSAIGPFYLAYGYTERGNHSFYIFLGRPFGQRGRILSL